VPALLSEKNGLNVCGLICGKVGLRVSQFNSLARRQERSESVRKHRLFEGNFPENVRPCEPSSGNKNDRNDARELAEVLNKPKLV
jgi:hypothetical protein